LRFLLIGFGPPLDGVKLGEGYPVAMPSACLEFNCQAPAFPRL